MDGDYAFEYRGVEVWNQEHRGYWELAMYSDVLLQSDETVVEALERVLAEFGVVCPDTWSSRRNREDRMLVW